MQFLFCIYAGLDIISIIKSITAANVVVNSASRCNCNFIAVVNKIFSSQIVDMEFVVW